MTRTAYRTLTCLLALLCLAQVPSVRAATEDQVAADPGGTVRLARPGTVTEFCEMKEGLCTSRTLPLLTPGAEPRPADLAEVQAFEDGLSGPARRSLEAALEKIGARADYRDARIVEGSEPGTASLAYPLAVEGAEGQTWVALESVAGANEFFLLWEFTYAEDGTGLRSIRVKEVGTGAEVTLDTEENQVDCPTTGICQVDCLINALCGNPNSCMSSYLSSSFFLSACAADPVGCAMQAAGAADCAGLLCNCPSQCSHSPCLSGAKLDASQCACAQEVCSVDPFCCQVEWDAKCVAEAGEFCPECGGGQPGCAHSPCEAGGNLDPATCSCAQQVCAFDPFCCAIQWDAVCAQEAGQVCPECGG